MTNVNLEKTEHTPAIVLDATAGTISITGDSYPEDSFEFYKKIIVWLKEYFQQPKDTTIINIDLPYMNSSSLKVYFDIFDIFEKSALKGNSIKVNWIYLEDNDIAQETGEDFQLDFENLDIILVSKEME